MTDVHYQLSKLIPMRFHTHYLTGDTLQPHVADWWQWRGRVFHHSDRVLGGQA